MTGIVVDISRNAFELARMNWRISAERPNEKVNPLNLKYVLFVVDGYLRAAAEVLSVTNYPNAEVDKWLIELSKLVERPVIEGLCVVDNYGHRSSWVQDEYDSKLLELFRHAEIVRVDDGPQLNVSISEAVDALSLRYDISPENIKITLHN